MNMDRKEYSIESKIHTQHGKPIGLNQMRFYLSVGAAQMLLDHYNISQEVRDLLSIFSIDQLKSYIEMKRILTVNLGNAEFGKARTHVLIGQQAFEDHLLIQARVAVSMVDPRRFLFSKLSIKFDDSHFQHEFHNLQTNWHEFANLEDDDHMRTFEENYSSGAVLDDAC